MHGIPLQVACEQSSDSQRETAYRLLNIRFNYYLCMIAYLPRNRIGVSRVD